MVSVRVAAVLVRTGVVLKLLGDLGHHIVCLASVVLALLVGGGRTLRRKFVGMSLFVEVVEDFLFGDLRPVGMKQFGELIQVNWSAGLLLVRNVLKDSIVF
jgi:hypothetical protein